MKFFAVVSLLAATALALPGGAPNPWASGNEYTVEQAQNKCGTDMVLSCCNKVIKQGDTNTVNSGLLTGLAGGVLGGAGAVGILEGCNKIDLTAPIGILGGAVGAQDLLNKQCTQNVACCQGQKSSATGGLIVANVAPCIPIGSIA
ncbi:hypothetical protein CNMCM5793_001912 [Aspergillus hiratsukae]|uniref:Hydrophobin n=1 Tax=Aspergillus hiratsukae TaxID=1194566 RepID=A0A8H6PCK7_9EURO|nr:hypothetical protein CNMCM5793_001912 [Aspergillus hiratsukae]KAF7166048.1 hypothetical protein CNMCM6106_001989 [Aspergillus hiratsukae]